MTEDNFEEFLKKAAQSYNAPPARTPREDMWSAIEAQRAAGPRVVYGGGSAMHEPSVRRFGSRVWLGAAAAAVLFLATGVGIGRWSVAPNTTGSLAAVNPPTPTDSGAPPTEDPSITVAPNPRSVASSQSGIRGAATSAPAGTSRSGPSQQSGRSGNSPLVLQDVPSARSAPNSAYQITAVRHLSEAEALLTSFRTRSATDQQMDAQLGTWARELLSNTRLLLDSPVANDPQRRPLLQDLELVLVQIVQLSPGSTPQDREMIEKTLRQDHVMTRLRTAIPAGSQRGS